MVGKALLERGVSFEVFHVGGSPFEANSEIDGVFDGIPFRYFPVSTTRHSSRFHRMIEYFRGTVLVLFCFARMRQAKVHFSVYIWQADEILPTIVKIFLRYIGVPCIQEANEWHDKSSRWIWKITQVYLCNATIAISEYIENKLNDLCRKRQIQHEVIRIPALVNVGAWIELLESSSLSGAARPYFLWTGDVDGYINDVKFMVLCLSRVDFNSCRLVIVGKCKETTGAMLQKYAASLGIAPGRIMLQGHVSDARMASMVTQAHALLLPMWDDQRSRARFPNKLGEFLASGRPVITCGVGEISSLLKDKVNAYICTAGDIIGFARNMAEVLRDTEKASSIGKAGRQCASERLNYSSYSDILASLFRRLVYTNSSD
jgi:glycosyltransferase involved in cell wall biosynthesis